MDLNLFIMKKLQEFMLIFRFEPNETYQPTPKEQAEEGKQWGDFIGGIAAQAKLVNVYQLGFDGVQLPKNLPQGIHIANQLTLGGTMVIKASNIEEARSLSENCPILTIGGTVEVGIVKELIIRLG